MDLYSSIEGYLQALKFEQGAARATCRGYQSQLRHFHQWMVENGYPVPSVGDFTTPVLRRFLYYLAGKGLRPRTIRSYFHPLTGLGKFLVDNGALAENPAAGMVLPKLDAAERKIVTDEEIARLMEACTRERNPRKAALRRAVLAVLVYAGLRRSEMLELQVDDVNLKEKSLLVRCGKGSKSRKVYLCGDAVSALREWLALRSKKCTHTYLFAYDSQRRLHYKGLNTLLEDIKAIAGLAGQENIKPHSLRHAAATRLLRNGANLRDIQAFLGHTQLSTTSIYLHSSEEQLRNISELTALQQNAQDQKEAEVIRLPFAERARSRRIARRA